MIKCEYQPEAHTFHDCETGCIDGSELVQVGALEVLP